MTTSAPTFDAYYSAMWRRPEDWTAILEQERAAAAAGVVGAAWRVKWLTEHKPGGFVPPLPVGYRTEKQQQEDLADMTWVAGPWLKWDAQSTRPLHVGID